MPWAEIKRENGITYVKGVYRDDGPMPQAEEGFEIVNEAELPPDAVRLEASSEKPRTVDAVFSHAEARANTLLKQIEEMSTRLFGVETSINTVTQSVQEVTASVDAVASEVEDVKTRVDKVESDIKVEGPIDPEPINP